MSLRFRDYFDIKFVQASIDDFCGWIFGYKIYLYNKLLLEKLSLGIYEKKTYVCEF